MHFLPDFKQCVDAFCLDIDYHLTNSKYDI